MKRLFLPLVASLLALICVTLAAPPAFAGEEVLRRVDAVVLVGGQAAGKYTETTTRQAHQIRDTVEQTLSLGRLGTQVAMRSRDVEIQDARGRLLGGHYESSSSKTAMTTDLTVEGHTLHVTTASGGKSYTRELPYSGELLGEAGTRALLKDAHRGQTLHFQTFVAELGAVATITLVPQGHEKLQVDQTPIDTLKLEYRIEGDPSVTTFWVDSGGYTVRALQDTPFGAVEIRRGQAPPGSSAQLPADLYERTLVVSPIRLPDPRHLQQVTLEIRARDAAGIEWPKLTGSTQRVVSANPHSLVLEVSQSVPGAYQDAPAVPEDYRTPNALLQSDDAEVRRIAAEAAGTERDPWKVVLSLQQWVHEHMHFDAGIGVAPAAEVARDHHGTCVGYAVLLAALARTQNIPSRLVMGYVYEDHVWGGHAWAEVLINGQWRAVDAAEYAPGVADAARIAVLRDSAVSGTIESPGDFVRLFGKIDIRIRSYRLDGVTVEVPADAADHTVNGDTYANRWLGLTLVKPGDAVFTDMDSHWPAPPGVVTVKRPDAAVTVFYADTGTAPQVLHALLAGAGGSASAFRWQGLPALRAAGAEREAVVATQGNVVWGLLASGRGGAQLLEALLSGVSLSPAAAAPR